MSTATATKPPPARKPNVSRDPRAVAMVAPPCPVFAICGYASLQDDGSHEPHAEVLRVLAIRSHVIKIEVDYTTSGWDEETDFLVVDPETPSSPVPLRWVGNSGSREVLVDPTPEELAEARERIGKAALEDYLATR
jgi:hypothetical protein